MLSPLTQFLGICDDAEASIVMLPCCATVESRFALESHQRGGPTNLIRWDTAGIMYVDGDRFIARWLSQLPSDADRDQALRGYIQQYASRRAGQAGWIDIFTMLLGALGARASPVVLAAMAQRHFSTQGHLDPRAAADAAFVDWHHDS